VARVARVVRSHWPELAVIAAVAAVLLLSKPPQSRGAEPVFTAFDPAPASFAAFDPSPARGVPAARPFRGPAFDPDHRCDACGYESPPGTGTWLIRGWNPDGTHRHQCPACGNVWFH
jgi:hypothetical protein